MALHDHARLDVRRGRDGGECLDIGEDAIDDRDRVEVALEIYVGDLKSFEALIPDDWLRDEAADRPTAAERMARYTPS